MTEGKSSEIHIGESIVKSSTISLLNILVHIKHISLNILIHDVINLLYYEHWTDKLKYFYVKCSDCEKVLGTKIDSKLHFWWSRLRFM